MLLMPYGYKQRRISRTPYSPTGRAHAATGAQNSVLERSAEIELLRAWNVIPENFSCLKNFATALLSMFSSTYACESLFSVMNFIKSRNRSSLIDETSSSCISLKVTKYKPNVKSLSAVMQQKSH